MLTTLPLCVRRRWPLAVALVISGAIAGRALVSEPLEIYPPALAGLVATYSVAAYAPFRQAVVGYVVALAGIAVAAATGTGGAGTPDLLPSAILLLTVWAIGLVVARRWSEVRAVAEQAEELDRRREEETRRAVEAERARIARDLHDSVAHSLAMIAIQAGGAASVLERDPAARRAEPALHRDDRAHRPERDAAPAAPRRGGRRAAPRAPARPRPDRRPGGGRAVRRARGATAPRRAVETPWLPGVGLTAYRIVQEALTNAAKHTPGGRTTVSLALGAPTRSPRRTSHGAPTAGAPGSGPRHRRDARARPGRRWPARGRDRPVGRVPRPGGSPDGGGAHERASAHRGRPGAGAYRSGDDGRRRRRPRARRPRRRRRPRRSRWPRSTGRTWC